MSKAFNKIDELRQVISLEQNQSNAKTDRGTPVANWIGVYLSVFASVEPLTGVDLERARQIVPNATHRVTVRFPDLVPPTSIVPVTWRVNYNGEYLYIGFVQDVEERHLKLVLTCYGNE